MFFLDDSLVTSASDLTAASKCEFAFLRKLDAKLGRIDRVDEKADAMLARTGRLGDEHEARVLDAYRAEFGDGVAEISRPDKMTTDALEAAVAATDRAFASEADVVFQATFFDGIFVGFADFIVRRPDGRYLVQDTKLARSAKVTALLQLAAYVEQLEARGVAAADAVELLLGNGTTSEHRVSDIMPVYRKRKERLAHIIAERIADTDVVAWGDERYSICGRCETCELEIQASRDVLLVAGMRVTQRARLANAGITTIEELAAFDGAGIDGMGDSTLAGLRLQADLQLHGPSSPEDHTPPPVRVFHPEALAALPEPDAGDIFFDFEGDPLYTEGDGHSWGLDYLFGLVDNDETFTSFWAHSFAEERVALREFLDFVAERRARFPHMHIYHYASYERTHLSSIAARHGIGEEEVDALLRDNVLVDLYPMVKKSIRVGSRSYSIKKLEPLYMGDELRNQEGVINAADSITEYADAMELLAHGSVNEGQHKLDEIGEYNKYDCVSTLRLRDWLLERGRENGVLPGTLHEAKDSVPDVEPSPLRYALLALAGDRLAAGRSADETAAAFAAAALDYHQREQKSFWWGHFARLVQDIGDWADTRDVLVVVPGGVTVEKPWFREGKQKNERRWLRLTGSWGPGSSMKPGEQAGPHLVYEYEGRPFDAKIGDPGARVPKTVRVLEVDDRGALVEETTPTGVEPYDAVPIALTPAAPPPAGQQKPAIEEWAQAIIDAQPAWPIDPVVDILRRTPPRTRSGSLAPVSGDRIDAVTESILDLDASYLAVQGPPGTGKTYLGAHVITALVQKHGWKIGVVAQSHAVVENLLSAVVKAGLPAELVGKVQKNGADAAPVPYTELPSNGQLMFAAEHEETGFVLGGTAWDFSNKARFPRHSLDLLVIDEAGQYSLAFTIAASVAARNLLLLGDPQQLPQVSQGLHPEPIDTSALGWVSDGHDVLPAELGYFLAESRRMHPDVTAPVSRLSYEGELHAHEVTSTRHLDGIEAGLHVERVEHAGNSTYSREEADRVVELVRSAIGRAWTDPTESRNAEPLGQQDIIVVSPYNAQVAEVRDALTSAGFGEVRVGTVDKFQGQEAAIAIMTLAASSAAEVPRGMGFLILKNRLNVAISRAKWAAWLVYSPALTDYLPVTAKEVAELSAFITLAESHEL
ncbi:TM0106 family RecB-like putative nuclease [Mycetocola zhadangensis]|uniref:TM0106 family RecB-like putative nuclease n=1 Tax=Mycetocola zhadangensis TaxID=1164595 RepID=A0A3L7J204_9MICO|nr:bifunctional RecB family nuclease/DEAD/DEAH box helicase [Mycetocola zhadangensis]RLQ84285.1 TM0106 family RecB-like putative nuclease [Mycetocola zhadangensis]GGE94397.1 ATPase [Mycetocola zhadangensis]